ncbi:MAG: amidohydrolase family protein [Deltaproteobacteria bacterium]|nr:amidohydrolase family protein [Deltaproteobacteria bacterium]
MKRIIVTAIVFFAIGAESQAATRIALKGTIVTPTAPAAAGFVVIEGGAIVCAGATCDTAGATVIDTGLDLYAGFVDAHNHIGWNLFPFTRFSRPTFNNRYNWRFGEKVFKDFQKLKSTLDRKLKCDVTLYTEVMAALGGTTTIVSEDKCHTGGIRNAENPGLGELKMGGTVGDPLQLRGKTRTKWEAILSNPTPPVTRFVIHLAEGRDASSLKEWTKLEAMGPPFVQNRITSIVHGIPLKAEHFRTLAERGWQLIWSPSSNMRLYQMTTDVVAAAAAGVNVALAPDWNLGGSPTLLQEIAYVRRLYADGPVRAHLTPARLLTMATSGAAAAIGLEKHVGTLAAGYRADIVGLRRASTGDALETLMRGDPKSVELVMVDGRAMVAAPTLAALATLPKEKTCEAVDVCGVPRQVCLATSLAALVGRVKAQYPQVAPLADCAERPLR